MVNRLKEYFENEFKKPIGVDDLYNILSLSTPEDFTNLAIALNALEDEFIITHNKQGLFAPLEYFDMVVGTLTLKDGGYGFVDTPTKGIYIPSSSLGKALSKDLVLIKVYEDKFGRSEGKIERIIKRGNDFFYGSLRFYHGKYFVYSTDSEIKTCFYIDKENLHGAKLDDYVKIKIDTIFDSLNAKASVVEVLGNKRIAGLDITTLVLASGINVEFNEEVKEEIKEIPSFVSDKELVNRIDLTSKLIISIDGADAKDLDDCISVVKNNDDTYTLGVYIADVSNYVLEDTYLDLEAFTRGTSCYLPDRVIPMLPKELSNGICSLNEGVTRLVMACEMVINLEGDIIDSSIFKGYIINKHRMTYDDVNKIIAKDSITCQNYADIVPMINDAVNLSKILYNKRDLRGAFNFEKEEPYLKLDSDGLVEDIILRNRGISEGIIEEFMLAANETVALTMSYLDVPFIYRVHEEPSEEKISRLLNIVSGFGSSYKIKSKKSVAHVLKSILIDNSLDDESLSIEERTRRYIINNELIRSQMKAKYDTFNIGHFGLASVCYTHFTSPIRRYPDLLVHRLIKEFLLNERTVKKEDVFEFYNKKTLDASFNSSKTERIAEKLERDATDYKICEYMAKKIGCVFNATISSITSFGIFSTLNNTVEGLTRYSDMNDDYYEYDEIKGVVRGLRKNITYQLGDIIKVKVIDVSLSRRTIDFKIIKKGGILNETR